MKVNYDTETRQSISPGDLKVCIRIGGILYEIGHLFSYSLTTAVESVPVLTFGNKFPISETKGKRSHQGTLIFNVINQSLVHELKEILKKTNNPVLAAGGFNSKINSGTFLDGDEFESNLGDLVEVDTDTENINAMDLPPFDIIFTAQDRLNPHRYSQKKIIGVTLYSQSSAIGIDTITTQDAYAFMCKHVTPLTSFESDTTVLNDATNELLGSEEQGNFISSFVY